MFLIVMGSKLVDPFGHDVVDIPLEAFCTTVESQIYAIDRRSKSGTVRQIAKSSKPKILGWSSENKSMHRISNSLQAR